MYYNSINHDIGLGSVSGQNGVAKKNTVELVA